MPLPDQLPNMHGKVALVAELAYKVPAERRASIRKCTLCSERVGLTSGSEQFIRKHGADQVVIVCSACVSEPVMETIRDYAKTNPAAHDNVVPLNIINQMPADTLADVLREARRKDDNEPLPVTPDQLCDNDHPSVRAIIGCIVTDCWIMTEARGIIVLMHKPGTPPDKIIALAVDWVRTTRGDSFRIRIGKGTPRIDLSFLDEHKCPDLVGSTFTGVDGNVVEFGNMAIRFVPDGIEVCEIIGREDASVN